MYFILEKIRNALNNDRGAGVVEVAVIIVILVALAIIFKGQIEAVLNEIIAKITEQIEAI